MIEARNRERGEGNLKFFIWIVIIVSIAYLLFKFVPPYVNDYQLKDTLQTEARMYAAHQKSADAVRKTVWEEIQSLGIPAQQDDIIVSDVAHFGHVEVKYTVAIDLPGYTYNKQFDTSAESPIL